MTPVDLGLPSRFTSFRPGQWEAVEYAIEQFTSGVSGVSIVGEGLPTGSGKTLGAMAVAQSLGVKAVYLTATKGLQDQIAGQFEIADVRGKVNYECARAPSHLPRKWRCLTGADRGCLFYSAHSPSCPYNDAVMNGIASRIAVTNYSWWLSSRKFNAQPLGEVELLICDEASLIEDELERALAIAFSSDDFELPSALSLNGDLDGVMSNDHTGRVWQQWALDRLKDLRQRISRMTKDDDDYERLSRLASDLKRVSALTGGWVWEWSPARERTPYVTFTPIWPGAYSSMLWSGISYVLLMSGTLRPHTMKQLVRPETPHAFREWGSVFPPQNGPVYHIPTVRLTWKSDDEDYKTLVARIDSILAARPGRKGIIHTNSYDRARKIRDLSTQRARLLVNENSGDSRRILAEHMASDDSVLVSPSFTTGYDFSDEACRFQIIAKTPFPNTQSRVMKERCKNPSYRLYRTAQTLAQMCGRGRRHEKDWCENFILDNSVGQFKSGEGKKYLPSSFQIYTLNEPPAPMNR